MKQARKDIGSPKGSHSGNSISAFRKAIIYFITFAMIYYLPVYYKKHIINDQVVIAMIDTMKYIFLAALGADFGLDIAPNLQSGAKKLWQKVTKEAEEIEETINSLGGGE